MKRPVLLLALAIGILPLLAQNRVVHGKLTAFNTYPVANVEISSKKAKTTITSDAFGCFSIVCADKDQLRIRPKGFHAVTKKVGPDTDSVSINLIFIDSPANRNAAVNYGYISEANLTYAVKNLAGKNNDYCNYTSIFDLLRANFSGISIKNNQVYIQGGNNSFVGPSSALCIVDGTPFSNLSIISPCQVSSIEILKGPQAAIYGSQGGNGVVVIQLRKD